MNDDFWRDLDTKIDWLQHAPPLMNWWHAVDYAQELMDDTQLAVQTNISIIENEFSDTRILRLAKRKEIEGLIDISKYDPAIKENCPFVAFPNAHVWTLDQYVAYPEHVDEITTNGRRTKDEITTNGQAWAAISIDGSIYRSTKYNQRLALYVLAKQ